jgi:protein O-mannosyl-transferase
LQIKLSAGFQTLFQANIPDFFNISVRQKTMENLQNDSVLDNKRAVFFLVLGCLLVYANSLSGDFVFDDTMQIAGNNALHSWQNIVNAFTTDVWAFQRGIGAKNIPPPYYRPLFTAYLTIGYQLFGLWQQGWHLLNLAIHTGATILVYRLFCLLTGGNLRLSLIGGLLFALIPVHVESVSWISGIPDPLAALFYVPAMIFYIRWREIGDKKFLIYSLLFFFLSLLCKETPIVLPLILLIWELTLNRSKNPDTNFFSAFKQVALFAIPAIVYLIIRVSVLGQINWKHSFNSQISPGLIYLTIPLTVVYYLKNIIFPFNLSLIYPVSFVKGFSDLNLWIPLIILIGLTALLYFLRRQITPLMWLAIGLFVIPLLPVLNLQVFHPEYLVQDRYLYLPSIGFVLFIATLIEKLWSSERKIYQQAALATVAVLCIFYAVGTILQNRVWRTETDLWTRAAETRTDSVANYYNLGLAHLQNKKYEEAIQNFDSSMKYSSPDRDDSMIYNNIGLAKKGLGKNDEAKMDFIKSLEINPKSVEANINLGAIYFDQGKFAEAETQFSKALQLNPSDVSANFNLARTQAKLGRHKDAINIYAKILQVEKQDAELMYYAAISYSADGQKEKAASLLNNAAKFARDETLKKQIADEMQKIK